MIIIILFSYSTRLWPWGPPDWGTDPGCSSAPRSRSRPPSSTSRLTICAETPPAAPNNPHQPSVTKPLFNGALNSLSTNQNAWPHSFKPTFGRMNIGPSTELSQPEGSAPELLHVRLFGLESLHDEWEGAMGLIESDERVELLDRTVFLSQSVEPLNKCIGFFSEVRGVVIQ